MNKMYYIYLRPFKTIGSGGGETTQRNRTKVPIHME